VIFRPTTACGRCKQEGKPPAETFLDLVRDHFGGFIRGPFNLPARSEAGFTAREMDALMEGIG
jgi:uncharacterized ferritin-like protein (DUF455 family)